MSTALEIRNVKDPPYNAVGNGSADDTTSIRTAIESLGADEFGGGGIVYFPPGKYRITGELTRTGHNLTLMGAGSNAWIIIADFATGNAIRFGFETIPAPTSIQFASVRHLGIDLRGDNLVGIRAVLARYLTLEDVYIIGPSNAASTCVGIQIDGGTPPPPPPPQPMPDPYSAFSNILRCSIQRLKIGLQFQNQVTSTWIYNNAFVGGVVTGSRGLVINNKSVTNLVQGNEFERWTDVGVRAEGANLTILTNRFEGNANYHIQFVDTKPLINMSSMTLGNQYVGQPVSGLIGTPNSPNSAANGIRIFDIVTGFDAPNCDGTVRSWYLTDYLVIGSGVPTTGAALGEAIIQHDRWLRGENAAGNNSIRIAKVGSGNSVRLGFSETHGLDCMQLDSGGLADAETAMYLLMNRGGTVDVRRVIVGPADSGGTGYRVLRVLN
jgi:hypothetical protein